MKFKKNNPHENSNKMTTQKKRKFNKSKTQKIKQNNDNNGLNKESKIEKEIHTIINPKVPVLNSRIDETGSSGKSARLDLFRTLKASANKAKKNSKIENDSDTESDTDEEEDKVACKSYMDDFGFKDCEQTLKGTEQEQKEKKEEAELIKQERLASRKRSKLAPGNDELACTLCVDNVNVTIKKKALDKFFRTYGHVQSVRFRNVPVESNVAFKIKQISNNKLNKKRTSMTAYVKFATADDCTAALKAHMEVVKGHHLLVRSSLGRESAGMRKDLSRGCTILVGGLPNHAEEETLLNYFTSCGEVADVTVLRNKGDCTGVAFVVFQVPEGVTAALKLTESTCCDRVIRVTKAVRKVKKNRQCISGSGKTGFSKNVNGKVADKKMKKKMQLKAKKKKNVSNTDIVSNKETKTATATAPTQTNGDRVVKSTGPTQTFTGQKFDQSKKKDKRKRRDKGERRKQAVAKKLASTVKPSAPAAAPQKEAVVPY